MKNSKNKTAEFFNKKYRSKEMYYGWRLPKFFTEFFEQIDLRGKRALDLGCGEGKYSLYLAGRGAEVNAIDISGEGIRKLRKLAAESKLAGIISGEVLDIDDYHFIPDSFDIIIAATVLGHLKPDLRERVVSSIPDTLAPAGLLYMSVFTWSDPGFVVKSKRTTQDMRVSETAAAVRYYFRPGELKDCFASLQILHYDEDLQTDSTHGKPHVHGWASLIARKPPK